MYDETKALSILQQLIRIRTPQPLGDELDAVKFIESLLHSDLFKSRILHHSGNRATLASEISGSGRYGKVALVGNLDTVGLEDIASWSHAPYAADFEGGRVYGRGAANNKGGVAAMLLAALALMNSDELPPRDVLFCFTADGDQGGMGAKALFEGGFFEGVSEVIFAQPTDCLIGIGQKGLLWLDVYISGRSAHVTQSASGINAFEKFIFFKNQIEGLLNQKKTHPILGLPSCNITKIESFGPTLYSVPDRTFGRLDIRFPPNIDSDDLLEKIFCLAASMETNTPGMKFDVKLVNKRSAVGMTSSAPIIKKIKSICVKQQLKTQLRGVMYFTDASVIVPLLGIPFAIMGPGEDIYGKRGDESVALDNILQMARVYYEFIFRP